MANPPNPVIHPSQYGPDLAESGIADGFCMSWVEQHPGRGLEYVGNTIRNRSGSKSFRWSCRSLLNPEWQGYYLEMIDHGIFYRTPRTVMNMNEFENVLNQYFAPILSSAPDASTTQDDGSAAGPVDNIPEVIAKGPLTNMPLLVNMLTLLEKRVYVLELLHKQ